MLQSCPQDYRRSRHRRIYSAGFVSSRRLLLRKCATLDHASVVSRFRSAGLFISKNRDLMESILLLSRKSLPYSVISPQVRDKLGNSRKEHLHGNRN